MKTQPRKPVAGNQSVNSRLKAEGKLVARRLMLSQRKLGVAVWPVVCLVLLGGCAIPPAHVSRSRVGVKYYVPESPSIDAEFICAKRVCQQQSKLINANELWPISGSPRWEVYWDTLWRRAFLWSIDSKTQQRRCLMELPSRFFFYEEDVRGFLFSPKLQKAVFLTRSTYDVVIVDISKRTWRTYDKKSIPNTSPRTNSDGISPDGSEFCIILGPAEPPISGKPQPFGLAICGFDGRVLRFFPTTEEVVAVKWIGNPSQIILGFRDHCVVVDPADFRVVKESRGRGWISCLHEIAESTKKTAAQSSPPPSWLGSLQSRFDNDKKIEPRNAVSVW